MLPIISLLPFPAESTLKSRLFSPLYTSFLVLVLLIVGQLGLNLWIEHLNHEAADRVTHTLLVKHEGERLLNAVIDEETAFLEDYREREIAFDDSFNRLYNLVEDNPTQLKQLEQIESLHNCWQSELRQKALSGSASSYTLREKPLFDALRTHISILIQRDEILLGERTDALHKLYHINTAINILSTVVILVGIGLNLWLLHQRVKLPLRKLTEVGKVWLAGKMEVRLGYSSEDEIGQLADVLDAMVGEASQRQQSIEVRNQQLEDLICALSHDLRTPLLATRTTLKSMLRGAFGPVNDTWREVFEEYREANEDLLKLVETLLNISRYEANGGAHLSSDPLDWERIFLKAIAQIKATSNCKSAFTYKISQSLPTVYGDEIEIRRVVQNLLDNAARVSEPNKKIFLEVATFGKPQVQVSVRDYGLGIAPQDKERLFHRFIQGRGRRGSSGLGLYLCRQIIEAHKGTIGVESSLGEGSIFWFTLPVDIDKAEFKDEKDINRKYMRRNDAGNDALKWRTENCADSTRR